MSSVVQVAFLSLLFWSVRSIAIHLGEAHPTLWALTASVFPSMVAWASMFHFAVASSALLAACVWAYLSSDGLTRWRPTMLFGLALGCLSLSRSVALVYVAALAFAVAWHLLRHWQGFRTARGLGLAGVVALVVAGPWWLVSGPGVLRYLLKSGYDDGSGFAPDQSLLERFTTRGEHTIAEWGWPVVATLVLLLALWAISAANERRRPAPPATGPVTPDARWLLLVLALVGVAMLASSSNLGTGFSLPFAPLLVLAVAGGSVGLRRRWSPRLGLALTAALAGLTVALSALSTHLPFGDATRLTSSWHAGLHHAGWSEGEAGPEEIQRSVVNALEGHDVMVLRDDALLNSQGLIFYSIVGPASLTEVETAPFGNGAWLPSASDLGGAIVISGRSPGNYHGLDQDLVATRLGELDYWMACELTLGPDNLVELWAPRSMQLSCPADVSSPPTP